MVSLSKVCGVCVVVIGNVTGMVRRYQGKHDASATAEAISAGSRARYVSRKVVTALPDVARNRYCGVVKKAGGTPCRNAPLLGGTHCKFHLGATSLQRRTAARNLELGRAITALQELGIDSQRFIDPRVALLEAVSIAHQTMGAVVEMVRSLDASDINAIGASDGDPVAFSAGARAETFLVLLNKWVERSAKTSQLALRVGLEDRMVHLAETQAALLVGSVRAAFIAAGTPSDVQEPFLMALAAQLRLVSVPGIALTEYEPTDTQVRTASALDLPVQVLEGLRKVSPDSVEYLSRHDAQIKSTTSDELPATSRKRGVK